jgi:hypothetical protein
MTDMLTRPQPESVEQAAVTAEHPLAGLLRAAARRGLPPVDPTIAVCPAPPGPCAAAVALGGLSVVAADVPREWVCEHTPTGPGAAVAPHLVEALAIRLGVPTPPVHVLLAARKPPQAGPRAALWPGGRVRPEWAACRTDVVAYTDADGGVIAFGRGPGGRWDLSVELDGADRPWLRASTVVQGRELLEAARTVAPGDLFASVPAYDATSVRTYLCGGFRVIGAEALFLTRPAPLHGSPDTSPPGPSPR